MSDARYPTIAEAGPVHDQREIDAVVKYLYAKAVGRGPATYEDCVEFWGQDTRQCEPMKK